MAKSKPAASKAPITPEQFAKLAKPLTVTIGGRQTIADVKEFSSGSLGWYCGDKVVVEIEGVGPVKVQMSMSLVIVGTKPDKK